ncbi:hypothetical protein V1281_007020 [Nitrobacteraceae bacterium AZCC 2161]
MTAVVYRASAALVTVQRVIRIVTGKPCRQLLEPDAAAKIGLDDMIIAVRFDRTPSACMAELRRLAAEKEATKKSRDLTLDQLPAWRRRSPGLSRPSPTSPTGKRGKIT